MNPRTRRLRKLRRHAQKFAVMMVMSGRREGGHPFRVTLVRWRHRRISPVPMMKTASIGRIEGTLAMTLNDEALGYRVTRLDEEMAAQKRLDDRTKENTKS